MLKGYKTDEDKKVKRLYHQRYRTEWEKYPELSSWLASSNDGYSAHCKICDINVLARLASIKQHLATRKHQNMIKGELVKDEHDPDLEASIISPKAKPKAKSKTYPRQKPRSKMQPKIKNDTKVESMEEETEEDEIASNDSILDDLLRTDQPYQEQEFEVENEFLEVQQNETDLQDQEVVYEEEMIQLKPEDTEINNEYQVDAMTEDTIISEFDLFGKSLALQLNNMDLEDALMCQERLQVVLTEFRLKVLKRKREQARSS
uniref:LD03394p n=1 Tax=Drosophila melanogaster TaxID=7227 RepID=Q9VMX2_DROME|nr:lethal (2) 05714, isoform C [Drosophila melanogaster]NP_652033.3 lethal (2) 05714, isoform A [Drosophila melanogaster]AAF52186.3 lethal (2) 05714, isoform A [Drosophila melanogaster]AAL28612.1 LD03394p [Drosophila melanogaster]AGB92598.1 lethal (2) 05714, isoform C [Drosophila melanogaster]|eukprot:NP_001260062.1 lethal (2) 05714, isoform C [Drosophila melanogaster]